MGCGGLTARRATALQREADPTVRGGEPAGAAGRGEGSSSGARGQGRGCGAACPGKQLSTLVPATPRTRAPPHTCAPGCGARTTGAGVNERSLATLLTALGCTLLLLPTPLPGVATPQGVAAAPPTPARHASGGGGTASVRARLPSAVASPVPARHTRVACRGVASAVAPCPIRGVSCSATAAGGRRGCAAVAGAGRSAERLLRQHVAGATPRAGSRVATSIDSADRPAPAQPGRPSAAASCAAAASAADTSCGFFGGPRWVQPRAGSRSKSGSWGRHSAGRVGWAGWVVVVGAEPEEDRRHAACKRACCWNAHKAAGLRTCHRPRPLLHQRSSCKRGEQAGGTRDAHLDHPSSAAHGTAQASRRAPPPPPRLQAGVRVQRGALQR